jgi:isocitrate dehydrogenase (NAD+)
MSHTITVVRGDGIGPEIMAATLAILDAVDSGLEYEFAEAGLSRFGGMAPSSRGH